jgi:hypothetical protein
LNSTSINGDGNWLNLPFADISRELAAHFHVNIVLVQQNTAIDQINTMIETNFSYGGNPAAPTIYIGNIGNMHFVQLNQEEGEPFNRLSEAVQQHIANLLENEEENSESDETVNSALG